MQGGSGKGRETEREKVLRCHGDQIQRASRVLQGLELHDRIVLFFHGKNSVPQSCEIKRLSSNV